MLKASTSGMGKKKRDGESGNPSNFGQGPDKNFGIDNSMYSYDKRNIEDIFDRGADKFAEEIKKVREFPSNIQEEMEKAIEDVKSKISKLLVCHHKLLEASRKLQAVNVKSLEIIKELEKENTKLRKENLVLQEENHRLQDANINPSKSRGKGKKKKRRVNIEEKVEEKPIEKIVEDVERKNIEQLRVDAKVIIASMQIVWKNMEIVLKEIGEALYNIEEVREISVTELKNKSDDILEVADRLMVNAKELAEFGVIDVASRWPLAKIALEALDAQDCIPQMPEKEAEAIAKFVELEKILDLCSVFKAEIVTHIRDFQIVALKDAFDKEMISRESFMYSFALRWQKLHDDERFKITADKNDGNVRPRMLTRKINEVVEIIAKKSQSRKGFYESCERFIMRLDGVSKEKEDKARNEELVGNSLRKLKEGLDKVIENYNDLSLEDRNRIEEEMEGRVTKVERAPIEPSTSQLSVFADVSNKFSTFLADLKGKLNELSPTSFKELEEAWQEFLINTVSVKPVTPSFQELEASETTVDEAYRNSLVVQRKKDEFHFILTEDEVEFINWFARKDVGINSHSPISMYKIVKDSLERIESSSLGAILVSNLGFIDKIARASNEAKHKADSLMIDGNFSKLTVDSLTCFVNTLQNSWNKALEKRNVDIRQTVKCKLEKGESLYGRYIREARKRITDAETYEKASEESRLRFEKIKGAGSSNTFEFENSFKSKEQIAKEKVEAKQNKSKSNESEAEAKRREIEEKYRKREKALNLFVARLQLIEPLGRIGKEAFVDIRVFGPLAHLAPKNSPTAFLQEGESEYAVQKLGLLRRVKSLMSRKKVAENGVELRQQKKSEREEEVTLSQSGCTDDEHNETRICGNLSNAVYKSGKITSLASNTAAFYQPHGMEKGIKVLELDEKKEKVNKRRSQLMCPLLSIKDF